MEKFISTVSGNHLGTVKFLMIELSKQVRDTISNNSILQGVEEISKSKTFLALLFHLLVQQRTLLKEGI